MTAVVEVCGELAGRFDARCPATADDDTFRCCELGVDGRERCNGVGVRPMQGEKVRMSGRASRDDESMVRNSLGPRCI